MTLRHLRIFVTVCETGSMTAAAQILYIAQPAISLAVSEMEEHYKVRLFDRISRRLYLTDSGRQALEYARHIIALFDEMEQGVGGGQAADRYQHYHWFLPASRIYQGAEGTFSVADRTGGGGKFRGH